MSAPKGFVQGVLLVLFLVLWLTDWTLKKRGCDETPAIDCTATSRPPEKAVAVPSPSVACPADKKGKTK